MNCMKARRKLERPDDAPARDSNLDICKASYQVIAKEARIHDMKQGTKELQPTNLIKLCTGCYIKKVVSILLIRMMGESA